MLTDTKNVVVEDIEYLRHGDKSMVLRLFRPLGAGPFPVVVDLHGGAWNKGSIDECTARDEFLAEAGIAAAALDFRHAADGYPTSSVDINFAIRWLKANASELRLDPKCVAITGQSSGGHLAMLAAMRPEDPRYAAQPLSGSNVDARVCCVGMTWPVINPISRYRYALRERNSGTPPNWIGDIPERHDTYWGTEAAMIEGNPMLALENGEAVETPPAIWIQGRPDPIHDYRDPESPLDLNEPDRFVANYRKAGGEIEIVDIEQATRSSETSFAPLAAFLRKHLT
jgi:acetyl esterase